LNGLHREVKQEEERDLEVVWSCARILKDYSSIEDVVWRGDVLDMLVLLRDNRLLDGNGIFRSVAKRVGRVRLNSYIEEWTKFERRPLRIRRA
jgi:hypothetical protein